MAQKAARRGPSHSPLSTVHPAASSTSPLSASAASPTSSPAPAPTPPASAWGKANPLIAATAASQPQSASASSFTPTATAAAPTSNGAVNGPDKQKAAPTKETTAPAPSPSASPAASSAAVQPSSEPSSSASSAPSSTPLSASLLSSVLQVSSHVRVTTLLGEVLEGEVFVYDAAANVLALQLPKDNPQSPDYSLLNTAALLSVQPVTPASSSQPAKAATTPPTPRVLPEVDAAKLSLKEAKALNARAVESSKIGVGVSARGQRMFDALSKLYGAVWQGSAIVLMDVLRLEEPYTAEQLSGGSNQQRQRIIKTIEAQRDREAQHK